MKSKNEFNAFAKSIGVNTLSLNDYSKITDFMNPSVIEERQMNITQLDVFSRLMMDRIIFLGTGIDMEVSNIVQAQLLFLDSVSDKDITIYIASGGGYVSGGYGIVDTMDLIKSDVATVNTSTAASMAAVILSNGTIGKRSSLRHARTMIHQPSGGMMGKSTDMEIEYTEMMKIRKELYLTLSENTGKTFEQISKDSNNDHWMTATESQKYGIIDKVIKPKKKKIETKSK